MTAATPANGEHVKFAAALCAIGVAASASAAAQTATPGGRFVTIGCISTPSTGTAAAPGPSALVLTDTRGERPLVYRLEGDADKLKLHVGHTVEIAGQIRPAAGETNDPIAGAPVMKVEKLTWIATTCRAKK